MSDLHWWEAIILGLVEGLTEYLPVSSTGHLLVAAEFLGLNATQESKDAIDTFAICIQIGAILAVVVLYQERIRSMIDGLLGRDEQGRQVLLATITAFLPAAVIGFFLGDRIKDWLFGPWAIAAAWIVGGAVILVLTQMRFFEQGRHELSQLTLGSALIIGFVQALALWPGVSRSLVTIIAAVALGLSLKAAVEFSFILGLVTLSAATVYEGARNGGDMIDTFGWFSPAIGLIVAFVSAVAAIQWMVSWLENKGFSVFGWYRLGAGLVLVGMLIAGVVSA